MEKTTIQLNFETLNRLKLFKKYERESYDELINSILDEVIEESLSAEEITAIQKSLEEIRRGKVHSIDAVAKEFEVTLS